MSRLIDCSIDGVVGCKVSLTFAGKLRFDLPYGWAIVYLTNLQSDREKLSVFEGWGRDSVYLAAPTFGVFLI